MEREKLYKIILQIKTGKTFLRSSLAKTQANKAIWDELKNEITNGYSIDTPTTFKTLKKRA